MQAVIQLGRQARDGTKASEAVPEPAKKGGKGKGAAVEDKARAKMIPMKQPLPEMTVYTSDDQVLI